MVNEEKHYSSSQPLAPSKASSERGTGRLLIPPNSRFGQLQMHGLSRDLTVFEWKRSEAAEIPSDFLPGPESDWRRTNEGIGE